MTGHIVGRESKILEEIRKGLKTVEVRLAKPRFRKFKPGDQIRIREDYWERGRIVKSKLSNIRTEVTKVEFYPDFRELLKKVGYQKVNPSASGLENAISRIYMFYSREEEKRLGAVAIHFKLRK